MDSHTTTSGGPLDDDRPTEPGSADPEAGLNGAESHEQQSPLREASTTVAGAIESVLAASDTRHQQISETLSHLRQRQQEAEGRLGEMEQQQRQMTETASTILSNQKTGARCYEEVTAALSAIRKHQQEDAQRLSELATRTERAERTLRRVVLIAAGAQAVVAGVAVVVAVLLAG